MPTQSRSSSCSTFSRNRPRERVGAAWCCTCCGKLLGVRRDGRLHIRIERGAEYLTALPATATCRGCGTLNRISGPQA